MTKENRSINPSAPPPPYCLYLEQPPAYNKIVNNNKYLDNPKKNRKNNFQIYISLVIFFTWMIFLGISIGAYFVITAIINKINRLKNFINAEQETIESLTSAITEELKKVESLPKYLELTNDMQNVIDSLPQDQALNYFLSTNKLNIESYYKYSSLYLVGNFQKFPFSIDHYRQEYTWIDTSYTDPQNLYHPGGYWNTQEVFDYREYLEIRGSVNTSIAQKFRDLYGQRDYMKSDYRKLLELKEQHSDASYGEKIKIGGMIAGTVCICIALSLLVILAAYISKKLYKKMQPKENLTLESISENPTRFLEN